MKQLLIVLSTFVSIAVSAQCDTTINNTVSAITVSSATVSTGTISGALNYRLKYVRTGFTDTVTVDGASNIKAITGLQANTVYRYYFTVTCASGTQRGQRLVYSFRTLGSSIVYTPMTAAGYEFKYGSFDSGLHVPNGDTSLLRAKIRSGGLRYRDADSSLYVWTGWRWLRVSGSGGGGGSQTWEQTLQQGATATTLPIISRSFLGQSLRFLNPSNSNQVNFVMGSASEANRTLTMPIRSGRLATWSPRTECVNDSLYAFDEGVRYWTGTLCTGGVTPAPYLGANGIEVVDSFVRLRSAPYGSGNYLYWDSAGGTFSVQQADGLGSESLINISNASGFELYHKRYGNAQIGINNGNPGRFEILSEHFGEGVNAIYILDSAQNPSGNFSSRGLYFSVDDSIYITKYNTSENYIPYDKQSADTTGKLLVLMDDITGALTTISPSLFGGGGGADSSVFAPLYRIDTMRASLYARIALNDTIHNRIRAGSSAGLTLLSNSGTIISQHGAGGGNGSTFMGGVTVNGLLQTGGSQVITRADSNSLYSSPHDLNVKADSILSLDDDGIALTTLGMSAKFISANRKLYQITASLALANNIYQGIYFTVKTPTLVTGVRWLQVNTGNYTASTGFNGFGLYSYNATTDSLEIIRETASEPNIWQRASSTNSWQSAAFTSTTTLQPGVYYIGWSYNNSAQASGPTIGAGQVLQTGSTNLPNGKRLQFNLITSTPSLPSRIGWGSTTSTGGSPFILIY